MLKFFKRYPCLLPAVSFAIGILCDILLLPLWICSVLVGMAAALWIIAAVFTPRRPSIGWKLRWWRPAVVAMTGIAAGFAIDLYHCPEDVDFECDRLPMMVVGEVKEVRSMTYGTRAVLDLEYMCDKDGNSVRPLHNIKAIATTDEYHLVAHDRIMFYNALQRIKNNPNYPNHGYVENLARQGILWRVDIGGGEMTKLAPAEGLLAWCDEIRNDIYIALEYSDLQRPTKAFIATMLLGDSDMLTADLRQVFADAGISHILAVSGLHTGIIASLICLLTAPLVLCGLRRSRYALAILLTWGYILISGCHVSAVRSAVMVSLVMGALIMERRNSSFNALCLAALLILIFSPRALLTPGMQLSFLCVGTLVCFGSYFSDRLHSLHPIPRTVLSAAVSSCLAVFGSWAVTAYYFHSLPLLFLPVNLLVLPLLPLYLIFAVVHVIAILLGSPIGWIAATVDSGFDWLLRLCRLPGDGSVLHFEVTTVTPLLWLLGIIILGYALHRPGRKAYIAAGATLTLAIASIWLFPAAVDPDGIILRQNRNAVEIAEYKGGEETLHTLRLGSSATLRAGGKKICIKGVDNDSIHRFPDGCDLLVIAGNTHQSLSRLRQIYSPKRIVIHPGIYDYRREKLFSEAHKSGIDYYDLDDSPLRLLDE